MKFKAIFGAGLVLASSPVSAADWIKYSSSSDGTVYYFDMDRIGIQDDKLVVWTKQDYTANKSEKAASAVLKRLVDCHRLTITMISIVEYARNGSILTSIDVEPHLQQPQDIVPDSTAAGLSEQLCAK